MEHRYGKLKSFLLLLLLLLLLLALLWLRCW